MTLTEIKKVNVKRVFRMKKFLMFVFIGLFAQSSLAQVKLENIEFSLHCLATRLKFE